MSDYEPGTLIEDLRDLLNRHSAENSSNTPDFILAAFLLRCLAAFDVAVSARDSWHNVNLDPIFNHKSLKGL